MLRLRLLLLLAGCLVLASAALADDIGYVDCSSHPDATQIYGKARQSTDIVGSVPCGERFIVLLYGFIFSRVQTADSKVGYVLSSLITIDHTTAALQRQAARPAAVASTAPVAATPVPAPAPQPAATSVQVQSAPVQTAQASPEVTLQSAPASATSAPVQMTSSVSAPAPGPASAPVPTSTLPQSAAMVTQASSSAPASVAPQPAVAQPAPSPVTPAASTPAPDPAPRALEPSAPVAQPAPSAASQPDPAPAQPVVAPPSDSQPAADPQPVEPIRNPSTRQSWERPNPAGHHNNLLDLYGGFAFSRFAATSSSPGNLMGGMGAFGYNLKSWLQIVGDTTFNYQNSNGTKNVLYGNHYGFRYFYRRRHLFGITPFAEGMVGGSRLDTTVSGTKTSSNCISYKVGGGLDVHPTRHLEIRLLDVDYYRTSFGTNTTQTSYWATAGIVLRLFGSNRPY